MKRINKILGLGIGIVAAFGLASCTNETTVVDPENPGNDVEEVTLNLVKTPDFYAWSGSQVLGDTRTTRGTYTENGKTYYIHDEEVEVNLSILDQKTWGTENPKITDLAAKLSVHVRQEVVKAIINIPIPADYIIDSDDLAIFQTHKDLNIKENIKNEHQVSYDIGGGTVTATVSFPDVVFAETQEGEENHVDLTGPITVTLEGLSENVIKTCLDNNKDGINFEIYIYIQNDKTNYTSEEFKGELDNSTISFDEAPKYYINAFTAGYDENGNRTNTINPNDCTVAPAPEEGWTQVKVETENGEIQEFPHLNGSPYNQIWMQSVEEGEELEPDHAHGGPIEVPDQGKNEDGTYKEDNTPNQETGNGEGSGNDTSHGED